MELNDLKILETAAVNGITALSDRPNVAHTYGGDALSAKELKERFDKLPSVIIEKFNDLLNYFSGGSFPNDITFDQEAPFKTLKDFLDALTDGRAAETIKAYVDATKHTQLSTLQTILSQFERDKVSKKNAGEEIELKKFILDSSPETLQSIIYALYDKDGALGEDITDLSSDIKAITNDYENGSTAAQIMVADENSDLSSLKNVLNSLSKEIDDIDVSDQIKEMAVLLNPTEQEQTINSDIHILGRLLVDKGIECKDYLVIDSPSYRNQSYIVFPTGDKYFGADTYVQDAFAIAIDKPTRTMRIGVGMIYYDETGKKRSSFAFGWTISGSSEDEAVATREDKITDGNIPQWDDKKKMFVDSGVSLGDISAALDELHAYAQALVTGGAAE